MLKIALTGATGFIGQALLNHLTAQGFYVKALYRPSSASPNKTINSDSVEWIAGALEDEGSLHTLVTDVDVVVHCAGAVRGATLEHFKKINTAGVKRLLQAAVEHQVPNGDLPPPFDVRRA